MNNINKNKIRIKDIAKLAGISSGTVDRVIHNRGQVSEENRKKVLAIIEELKFSPNKVAKSLATKKEYRIGVLIPGAFPNSSYWKKPIAGITEAAKELKDFNTSVNLHIFDINSQADFQVKAQELLHGNYDGLIISPVFRDVSCELIQELDSQKLPYIFIDSYIEGRSPLAFFGQNAGKGGSLAAKLIFLAILEDSDVVIIKLAKKEGILHHLVKREIGFLTYFNELYNQKKTRIHSFEIDALEQNDIYNELDKVFASLRNIRGIFIPHSKAHIVAGYLEKNNLKDIILIGCDLIEENIAYLEKGIIDFLIGQRPEEQGFKSIMAMYEFLSSGKKPSLLNFTPIDLITKENIDS